MTDPGNTHYALRVFAGDFDADHPDPALRGHGPDVALIACGPEDWCWRCIERHTLHRPLTRDETVEVVARDPALVRDGQTRLRSWRERAE